MVIWQTPSTRNLFTWTYRIGVFFSNLGHYSYCSMKISHNLKDLGLGTKGPSLLQWWTCWAVDIWSTAKCRRLPLHKLMNMTICRYTFSPESHLLSVSWWSLTLCASAFFQMNGMLVVMSCISLLFSFPFKCEFLHVGRFIWPCIENCLVLMWNISFVLWIFTDLSNPNTTNNP